jgi:hypothetical protein
MIFITNIHVLLKLSDQNHNPPAILCKYKSKLILTVHSNEYVFFDNYIEFIVSFNPKTRNNAPIPIIE